MSPKMVTNEVEVLKGKKNKDHNIKQRCEHRASGHWGFRKTYPTLKTSANLRNAELMRIGNGYFWKSLGKRTTASHCSPSLPDLRPVKNIKKGEQLTHLWLQQSSSVCNELTWLGWKRQRRKQSMEKASPTEQDLFYLPWKTEAQTTLICLNYADLKCTKDNFGYGQRNVLISLMLPNLTSLTLGRPTCL